MSDSTQLQLLTAAVAAAGISPARILLPEDRYVRRNGIRFHYLDWGNAHLPHVVLLHGGSLQAHTWDPAALLLRDHYHIVALSQRGHGDSGWTADADLDKDGADLMLEDTRAFLEYLAYPRFALVGMSMGGINTMRYAARHQERLAAVGIVDVAPESMRDGQIEMESYRQETESLATFDAFLERSQKFMPHRPVAHLRYSLTHALKELPDGSWTWKQDHRRRGAPTSALEREARAAALWQDLQAIRAPTILFRGEQSKILSAAIASKVISTMRDAREVVIPRATHNVHSDNPGDFAAALDRFLRPILLT